MKKKSLVIANKYAAVKYKSSPAHTAHHAQRVLNLEAEVRMWPYPFFFLKKLIFARVALMFLTSFLVVGTQKSEGETIWNDRSEVDTRYRYGNLPVEHDEVSNHYAYSRRF